MIILDEQLLNMEIANPSVEICNQVLINLFVNIITTIEHQVSFLPTQEPDSQ